MKTATLVLTGLLILACQSALKADYGNLGVSYLFGYGGFGAGGVGVQSFTPAPPYFALHPPVYYGQRYTRPYGVSPFAAWPQLQSNSAYAPQPHVSRAQVIANPHCCGGASHSEPVVGGVVQSSVPAPLEIDNPYFVPEAKYTSK